MVVVVVVVAAAPAAAAAVVVVVVPKNEICILSLLVFMFSLRIRYSLKKCIPVVPLYPQCLHLALGHIVIA